ncbi:ABC transporter ATP-binding protein [Primorskyibacter flagellatus]|uniref:ABC transporter ATP-binding protein n=1 Tax=Primorskyibacter flagellatus TaxID=1387277 RepID=A0A917AEJ5_9RHOB|nr:dipeptide ABC transporter ATP-binding protein [Primorskyibacter flagellatus]GGE46945.1 ABC transporter ATP-binding protein [Primorskyibacter flagellatus]
MTTRDTGSAGPEVLSVQDLVKHYPVRRGLFAAPGTVHAVDGIDLRLMPGETLGLVGESGCGKSSAGKTILGLTPPTSGVIRLNGRRIDTLSRGSMRPLRKDLQVVFQDPFSSLNPRMTVGDILAEPLRNFDVVPASGRDGRIAELLDRVGLPAAAAGRYPYEFSGGQRQRIGIARALAPEPKVIVCDESVSALDVSVQAQVINLLMDLQRDFGISYLFIAHDLAVVEHISHRVAVMYLGRIVEIADKAALYARPQHPYTEALLSAVPRPEPGRARTRIPLKGDVPSPLNPPSGCRFHTRCPLAIDRCRTEVPAMTKLRPGHSVACHLRTPD